MKKIDLLIKAGCLVDVANRREGRFDIALAAGQIVRGESEINPNQAKETFNARNKLVLPGLVDTHVHLTPPTRAGRIPD
jgi:dihydroorotase-like cyclic amidohydrolase